MNVSVPRELLGRLQNCDSRDLGRMPHYIKAILGELFELAAAPPDASKVEPVAWRREWRGDVSDANHWMYEENESDLDEPRSDWEPLYAHPPAPSEQDILERCAKICEEQFSDPACNSQTRDGARSCAAAIRAAKERG